MKTKIFKINKENNQEILEKAAYIIKGGGLVVFPTETVYGLGANAYDEKALSKIFLAKGRPSDNPLIVHIYNQDQLKELTSSISENQQKLMDIFWPGPLTIIFDKKKEISNIVSGGLSTVAVRMPSNSFACRLISLAGVPIAAPSANISGRPSGTTVKSIQDELSGKVDIIIDAGLSNIGIESTVVKINSDHILMLRPGSITKEDIEKAINIPVLISNKKKDLQASPGTRYRHYSPKAKLEIVHKGIEKRAKILKNKGLKIGIISVKQNNHFFGEYLPNVFNLGDENNTKEISQNIYKALRFFDDKEVDIILCPSFDEQGIGVAIMDRLNKASG